MLYVILAVVVGVLATVAVLLLVVILSRRHQARRHVVRRGTGEPDPRGLCLFRLFCMKPGGRRDAVREAYCRQHPELLARETMPLTARLICDNPNYAKKVHSFNNSSKSAKYILCVPYFIVSYF